MPHDRPTPSDLVDVKQGLVSRTIFFDEAIYRRELERVFARCWLYLGHESQIREPGDYVTNYMGEDLSSSGAILMGGCGPSSTPAATAG